jgi:hypothetical protein
MEAEMKPYRRRKTVEKDWKFPRTFLLSGNPENEEENRAYQEERSRRTEAIIEVLRKLPLKEYDYLLKRRNYIQWVLPGYGECACVRQATFPLDETIKTEDIFWGERLNEVKGYTFLIILHYSLEHERFEFIVETIAHELAHIFLNHYRGLLPNEEWQTIQEIRADELVDKWGLFFNPELKSKMIKRKRDLAKALNIPLRYLKVKAMGEWP